MSDITVVEFFEVSEESLKIVAHLEAQIFENPLSEDRIRDRLARHSGVVGLVAVIGGDPVGFKIGYRDEVPDRFYSWTGGILPEFRGRGIARLLMEKQHAILKEKSYKVVRTKTKNKFRSMLVLNLKNGFDITQTYKDTQIGDIWIELEKVL